ncbi:MAG: GMC family oxidoreductase N-terminal domain-containing protein [Myxococcota bacterium]
MTELRVDATKTSKPLPAFLLKTFEAYLPYVLGLTGPEHEERVKVATQRFDQYVQSLPPHEGTRDMLAFLIGWCWFQGTFVGRGTAPWNQSPEEREHYVGRLFRSDLRAADSAWTLVRAGIRFLPFVPANVPRASARDLAKSLREMMSLAYYSNPSADPITGYSRIWKRDFLARTDVDVVSLKGLRQPDVFDAAKVASVHHQGHPYDTSGLFACDGRPRVAVIGSGAGGAVVAARLAQAREGNRPKYDVAVFEAGPRLRPSQYPLDTMVGMSQLFEGGLLTLSRDLDIHLLRGRLVGGGTVMTSGLSVKLRPETMRRWTSTSGDLAIGVTWDELEDGFQAVHARQHMGSINPRLYTDASHLLGKGGAALPGEWEFNADNPQNNVMMGADQHPGGRRDQNGDFCIGCGLCNYGCHFGHKLSMDLTYLPDAEAAGARIHQNLPIEAITTERDAHGRVTATHLALGRGLKSRVSVDYVVIAAGAVGSPALLLRSAKKDGGFASLASFQDKRIGSGLGFNYGSGVVAQWPTDFARPGHLGFQIKYVATKAGDPSFDIDLPGGSFPMRYVLENAFVPPGLLSNVVPGIGADHLRWMKAYKRLGMCASTIGSPQTGRVLADRTVIYRLSCGEMDVNRRALASIARLYFAAGAQEVGFAGVRQPTEDGAPDRGMLRADARGAVVKKTFGEMSEDELLQELAGILETPEHIMLSSAHPQGGLAMRSAVGAGCVRDFRLDGTENVFVVDGSIFPSTIVVNPQWTIAALAEVASQRIDNEIASAL